MFNTFTGDFLVNYHTFTGDFSCQRYKKAMSNFSVLLVLNIVDMDESKNGWLVWLNPKLILSARLDVSDTKAIVNGFIILYEVNETPSIFAFV